MKKIIFFTTITIFLLFLATSCVAKSNKYFVTNRTDITEIKGTAQASDSVKTAVIANENKAVLCDKIDSLQLIETDKKADTKGWEYLFNITYSDGNTISISLSAEQITIDGYIYTSKSYDSSKFDEFFE